MSDAQNVVQHCIKIGLEYDPPKEILEYCGAYYSPYYNFAYAMMCAAGTYWPSVVAVELGVEKARCSFSMLQYEKGIVIGLDTHPTSINPAPRFQSIYLSTSAFPFCISIQSILTAWRKWSLRHISRI